MGRDVAGARRLDSRWEDLMIKAAGQRHRREHGSKRRALDACCWTLSFGFELIIGTSPTHSRIFDR